MADYLTTDTELTNVANAIRTKGGTSAALTYPAGFVSAIQAIPTGGGSANTCTMTIDADGVTCSDFSDHTPTGGYAAVAAISSSEYPMFLFYTDNLGEANTFAIADSANPGWSGALIDPINSVSMYDGDVFDAGEPLFYLYEGTYTATVIEP